MNDGQRSFAPGLFVDGLKLHLQAFNLVTHYLVSPLMNVVQIGSWSSMPFNLTLSRSAAILV